MTIESFKAQMLAYALGTAKVLHEMTLNPPNGEKLEPEQVRKNASTILVILTETEDFLKNFNQNTCSNSTI